MMKIRHIAVLLLLCGCAPVVHKVDATPKPVDDVGSTTKLPGRFALVFDKSVSEKSTINLSYRAHDRIQCDFKVKADETIKASTRSMLTSLFEQISEMNSIPTAATMKEQGLTGIVVITLTELYNFFYRVNDSRSYSHLSCFSLWPYSKATRVDAELKLQMEVRGIDNVLFFTRQYSSAVRHINCPAAKPCPSYAEGIEKSITKALEDALTSMAKDLAKEPKLNPRMQ